MDAGGERVYDSALHDPRFRARLEAAYREAGGQGDPLVELWWRERAGRPHPDGLRDPALERAELVEAAYSQALSEQEATAAASRLRAFESHRRRQSDALDAALALTPRQLPRSPAATAATSSPPPSGAQDHASTSTLRAAAARHRVGLSVAALVVAAGLGAAVATSSGTFTRSPAATPTVDPSPPLPSSVLSRALARVQVPTDALPTALRGTVDPRSSRLIYDDDPSEGDEPGRWRLWIGTGENPQQLCFVATFDNTADTVSCLPRDRAFTDRFFLSQDTAKGSFEALVDDGAVAVRIT